MTEPAVRGSRGVRIFALVCVAVTTIFVIGMSVWLNRIIASTDYCGKVVGSAKYADGRPDFAIKGCVEVMRDQLSALSNTSLIYAATVALCLLVLMVVVVAEAHLRGKASTSGLDFEMGGRGDHPPVTPAEGAQAATDAAAQVTEQLAEAEDTAGKE